MSADRIERVAHALPRDSAIDAFREKLHGELLLPVDPMYDLYRRVWNGIIDKRPALIARCADPEDVVHSVRFARDNDLVVAVRSGGHSFPGHSVCDGGLMIDLSPMKAIQVDPTSRTARAEPGVLWGEMDESTYAHGLAVTGGQISHTGIAGLTLGGGIGWLMRKYGMTCDNLLSAEVVTAEGETLTASELENPDLFWGLRGGGGNFGVVTSFEYRLHPLGMMTAGLVAYPLPEAPAVLSRWRDYIADSPEELTTTAALLTSPDGHPTVGIAMCYAGDPGEGEKFTRPLRSLGTAVMDQVGPMPYPVVQSMLNQAAEPGRRYYVRGNLLEQASDEFLGTIAEHYAQVASPFSAILVVQMGGAMSQVAPDETAFPHRSAAFALTMLSCWMDPAADEANIRWTQDLSNAVQPQMGRAAYVNELGDEGEGRVRMAYGGGYERLATLKRKYDPTNFFHLNQNIKPAV